MGGRALWATLGAAFAGLFVGCAVGLSTSSQIGAVVTACLTLISSWIALAGSETGSDADRDRRAPLLFSYFAALLIGCPLGLYIRTHELLSPNLEDEYALLKKTFDPDTAKDILIRSRYGLDTKIGTGKQDSTGKSVLFSADQTDCQAVLGGSYSHIADLEDALKDHKILAGFSSVVHTQADTKESIAVALEFIKQACK